MRVLGCGHVFFAIASGLVVCACVQTNGPRKDGVVYVVTRHWAPSGYVASLEDAHSADTDRKKAGTEAAIVGGRYDEPVYEDGSTGVSLVPLPPVLQGVIGAVGRTRPVACTATHVGKGIAISAGHCALGAQYNWQYSLTDAPTSVGTRLREWCSSLAVDWGVTWGRNAKPAATSKCANVLNGEYSQDRDYIVFSVSEPPSISVPVNVVRAIPDGASISILGYPGGRGLMWSTPCKLTHQFDVLELSKDYASARPSEFTHDCTTDRGESGSPVFDEWGTMVGIHDGGNPDRANWGTHLYAIHIQEQVKSLRNQDPREETVP